MADPVTLSAIAIGSTVAGGLTKAVGGFMGGQASSSAYNYQSGVARLNASIQKQNASYERDVGEVKAQASGMKTAQQVAQIKSVQSGSNLSINGGSAANVRESQQAIGEFDQNVIRSNAARRAYGYDVEVMQQETQSNVYKMAGSNAKRSGMIEGISSLLGTASSVASKWLDMDRTGIGSGGDRVAYQGTGEWWNG